MLLQNSLIGPEAYAQRRDRLRELLHGQGLSAMLVSLDANRFYLSGFELHDVQVDESAGCLLIQADGKDRLFTDARYLDAAKRLWDAELVEIYPNLSGAAEFINAYCRKSLHGDIGFESGVVSVAFYNTLAQGLVLKPVDGLVQTLRVIKDKQEIALLRQSARLNQALLEWLPGQLKPGLSEAFVAWSIEKYFREHGASEMAFSPIVAVGPNGALPHAIPGAAEIFDNSPVLVDVGARLAEYNSDQTRTFWVGDQPTPVFLTTLEQVQAAQRRAIAGIAPGVPMADIYALAWNYLDECGVAAHFTHGLGHGVGLQTHEAPSLSPRSKDVLQAGMVVTVEPGLYYPDWGGVRWEHMVLVTEDGHEVL